MRIFTLIALVALSAGCASQPGAPATPAAAPAPTPNVAPTVAPASTATSEKPAAAPPGYRLVTRRGATLYCQKSKTTGSSLPQEICVTPEAYAAMEERAELDRQNFRRNSTLCGTGGCGGN